MLRWTISLIATSTATLISMQDSSRLSLVAATADDNAPLAYLRVIRGLIVVVRPV